MTHLLNNKNIKHYLENNPEQFRIYDIPYLQKTKKCLDNFKIENTVSYTNYGDNNLEDLKDYLRTIGSNSEEDINIMDKTLKDLTEVIMSSVDKKYTNHWLIVRTSGPQEEFNIKRWHCDDNYFEKMDKEKHRLDVVKFITIIQGPGTFFIKTTPKQRESLKSIKSEELEKSKMRDPTIKIPTRFDMEYRKAIDSRIEGIRVQSEKYQAAIFVSNTNNLNVCGIHSEPKIDGPRMLFSIVPCTKEEADFDKSSRSTIPIGVKGVIGGSHDVFYMKYMKYKNKYLQLKKQVAGGLIDKVYMNAIHELDNIQKLLDESVLCSTNEKKEINVKKFKELSKQIVNNLALKKPYNENINLLNQFNESHNFMLDSIKNKCNVETIETIRVKFEYINEELQKIINIKYGGLAKGDFILHNSNTVEVEQVNGRTSVIINYFDKDTGATVAQETISNLAAEAGERLMIDAIRAGPAPNGAIFALISNPAKQVLITQNIGNLTVNFQKITGVENKGQHNEKLLYEVPPIVWGKKLPGFLAEYTRVK
jgi:hypothetical protein